MLAEGLQQHRQIGEADQRARAGMLQQCPVDVRYQLRATVAAAQAPDGGDTGQGKGLVQVLQALFRGAGQVAMTGAHVPAQVVGHAQHLELRQGRFQHVFGDGRSGGDQRHAAIERLAHPRPLVRVWPGSAFFSRYWMIIPATSLVVVVSMPARPGEEFTSMTSGPWLERRISTPATFRPMTLAARTAVMRSSGVILIRLARPPRCRLERNSPALAWRFIAAITLSPTTKQRMSAPPASLMYSCTMMSCLRPRKASITDSAALVVSASTTPMP